MVTLTDKCKEHGILEDNARNAIKIIATQKGITASEAAKEYFSKFSKKKTETKPIQEEALKPKKIKKKREGMIYDVAYYSQKAVVVIQLNDKNECYFRFATGINKEGTGKKIWGTVKMNSTDLGYVLSAIDNIPSKLSVMHDAGVQKTILFMSDAKGLVLTLSIKTKDFKCSKMFNPAEMQSLKYLIITILPYLYEIESKV